MEDWRFAEFARERERLRMKIEVGMKLHVRADLRVGMNAKYGVNTEEVTVNSVCGNEIKIKEDEGRFSWSIEMFSEFSAWIKDILEKHRKWINGEYGGEIAVLSCVDLSGFDLSCLDLRCAILRGANLCYADLSCSNLSEVDLSGANLSDANLCCANLSDANLTCADLRDVKVNERTAMYHLACPEEGAFIGFKKCCIYEGKGMEKVLVKLEIPEDAKRSSATTRKCRCSKAKVISITGIESGKKYDLAFSEYNIKFVYRTGETVVPDSFDEDRWNECSNGIHFFVTKQEAIDY